MEENRIFFLQYVLNLIHLLEQKFCPDSNLRVKTMYESVKYEVLSITSWHVKSAKLRPLWKGWVQNHPFDTP